MSFEAFSQDRTVTGVVTSASDAMPLIGASVVVKGAATGTVSDFNGNYSLKVPDGATLVFSYVGYVTQTVPVGDQNVINVSLKEGTELDEVVVTALGVSREKKALGYAITEVSADDIAKSGSPNLVDALRARTPGVQFTQSSGAEGGGVSVLIRGVNSLDASRGSSPLYIIDGVEISGAEDVVNITSANVSLGLGAGSGTQSATSSRGMDINPDDIESVSVLKGAAATALYGVRAANGVIVIKTKRGQAGEPSIQISSSVGKKVLGKHPKVQRDFIDGHRNDSKRRSWVFYNWGSKEVDSNPLTHDLYNDFFQDGSFYDANVSVSAGTDRFRYRLSGGLFSSTGIVPNTYYAKKNFNVSAGYDFSSRLSVDGSFMYTNAGGNKPHEGRKSVLNVIGYTPNTVDLSQYDKPYTYNENFSEGIIDHALFLAEHNTHIDDVNRYISSVNTKYKITDNLSLNYTFGLDNYTDNRERIVDPETDEGHNMTGFIADNFINSSTLTSNLLLNWKADLSDDISLGLTLGNTVYSRHKRYTTLRGEGLNIADFYNLYNATEFFQGNAEVRVRNIGAFAQLTTGYKNFLYLTVSGRNDWTSTLPKANRSYFFPSVDLSWILSDMVDLPDVFDFAKLRASYAIVGKDASPYKIGRYFGKSSNFPFNGVNGFTQSTYIGDDNLRPEFSKTIELGTEMSFAQNRIGLEFTYYKTTSTDMILPVPLSNATGASRYLTNAGSMENTGMEAVLYFTPIKRKGFEWTSSFNFATNEGKILSINDDIGDEIEVMGLRGVVNKYVEGGKVGDLYGNPWNRTENGDLIIESDGYPRVNWDTIVPMGNAMPDFILNWVNDISYKGLGLSIAWEWKKGGKAIDVARTYSIGNGQLEETNRRYEEVVFTGVKEDADGNYVPNDQKVEIRPTGFYRNWRVYRYAPEVYLQDASWFRIRNISLSYELPAKMFESISLSNAKVTFTAYNVYLNTPFKGFDPELNYFGANTNIYGYTGLRTPSTKNYQVKLNLTF